MLPEPLSLVAGQVLRHLIAAAPATRPELAAALGVTKQTVSSAVVELEGRDLAEAVGIEQGPVGRSAVRYGLHRGAGWVAGIDLGSERLRVAAGRLDGTVVEERFVPNAASSVMTSWPEQLELAAHVLAEVARDLSEAEGGLLGVGVAVGRPVPEVTDLVGEHVDDADARLLAALEPVSPAAVWTENDVNCAALAQLRYRPGFTADDVVHLQLGTGVGAAVVVGGRILRGARGRAGELRDLPTASGATVEQALGLRALLRPDVGPLPARLDRLLAAADAGDPAVEEVLRRHAAAVAGVVAQLTAVVDPQLVVLSGTLGGRPEVRRRVESACAGLGLEIPISEDPLGDAAAVLGATWLAADRVVAALDSR